MKTVYFADSFIDYRGLERKFIMAAVSEIPTADITEWDEPDETEGLVIEAKKVVSIGIAVCRPCDTFNDEIGKKIAQGKAIKYRDHSLYATDSGMINDAVVNALLKQEAEYFKQNPGKYLAGYDKDKAKYEATKRIEELEESLEEDEKALLDCLDNMSDDKIERVIEVFSNR